MWPRLHGKEPAKAAIEPSAARASEISTRAIVVFAALQALDVLTTMLGWRLGAQETNPFIARFIEFGPLRGLLFAKFLGVVLLVAVVIARRARLLRLLNLWFAGIVTWNLIMIYALGWMHRRW